MSDTPVRYWNGRDAEIVMSREGKKFQCYVLKFPGKPGEWPGVGDTHPDTGKPGRHYTDGYWVVVESRFRGVPMGKVNRHDYAGIMRKFGQGVKELMNW